MGTRRRRNRDGTDNLLFFISERSDLEMSSERTGREVSFRSLRAKQSTERDCGAHGGFVSAEFMQSDWPQSLSFSPCNLFSSWPRTLWTILQLSRHARKPHACETRFFFVYRKFDLTNAPRTQNMRYSGSLIQLWIPGGCLEPDVTALLQPGREKTFYSCTKAVRFI